MEKSHPPITAGPADDEPVIRNPGMKKPGGRGGNPAIKVSFEFFPPKTGAMEKNLWASVERLAPLAPEFVSVNYGAGGSTRARTHNTVAKIMAREGLDCAAHLTCVDATRDEIDSVVRDYHALGVRRIVALRGDAPGGAGQAYVPHPQGYAYPCDLVAGIKRIAGDFDISVAGYPERHPESADWGAEMDTLKKKVDAGAARIVTQYFFDNDLFDSYRERVAAAGIAVFM